MRLNDKGFLQCSMKQRQITLEWIVNNDFVERKNSTFNYPIRHITSTLGCMMARTRVLKYFIYIFFLIQFPSFVFSQWTRLYTTIGRDDITDIAYLNQDKIIISTSGGNIYSSTNKGNSWGLKYSLNRDNFNQIAFLDSMNGLAFAPHNFIGDQTTLMNTSDGGEHWTVVAAGNINTASTIFPLSVNELLVAKSPDGILKSNGSLTTFQNVYTMPQYFDTDIFAPYGSITEIQRVGKKKLYALGNSSSAYRKKIINDSVTYILKSTNNGSAWDTLWAGSKVGHTTLFFRDSLNGWLGGEYHSILRTSNGGISWQQQYFDSLKSYYGEIAAISSPTHQVVIAVTYDGFLLRSADGGLNWNSSRPMEKFNNNFNFTKITFLDSTFGIASGSRGTLLQTTDVGLTWTRIDSSYDGWVNKIQFVSSNIGWIISSGKLFKSINGGVDWNLQLSTDSIYGVRDIYMIDSLGGWATTISKLLKTTNGGSTWTEQPLAVKNNNFGAMHIVFYNSQVGVLFEVRERIPQSQFSVYNYVTTNGGVTWNEYKLNKEFISSFDKLIFTDPSNGYFLSQGNLWQTKDTAKTWNIIYQQIPGEQGYAFDFIDSLQGWIHFWAGNIGKTTDGGKTWKLSSIPYMNQVLNMKFADKNHGIAIGYEGSIFATIDGGETWFNEQSFTNLPLTTISMISNGNTAEYWIAGDGWNILHKKVILTNVNSKGTIFPQSFSLSQNYPNPFNPTTTISYQLPENSLTTLKVYDMLGREVAVLVNEVKNAGTYSVQWNATQFASGIYFATLRAGSFTSTKKLLLMK
jgi:photosystem II stability/assembly factor-like uncharacterized protein